MSLFIAGQVFPAESNFATEKIAVFAASIIRARTSRFVNMRGRDLAT